MTIRLVVRGRTVQIIFWRRWRLGRWRYLPKDRGPYGHIFTGWLLGPVEVRVFTREKRREVADG